MTDEILTKVIGYYARLRGIQLFCSGPACIIASSESALKDAIRTVNPEDVMHCTIRKTRLIDILTSLAKGAPMHSIKAPTNASTLWHTKKDSQHYQPRKSGQPIHLTSSLP